VGVGVVVPVNEIVEPVLPNGLMAVAALVIGPGVFVDTADPGDVGMPDPLTPGDVAMPVEPGEVVIEVLGDPSEDVLLNGVDMVELIDIERGDVGTIGVISIKLPLLPGTDPA